jgi:hypothetical protein
VEVSSGGEAGSVLDPTREEELFRERLADDLDTPGAVRLMEALAERILEGAVQDVDVVPGQQALREMGAIFGLRLDRTEVSEEVVRGWEGHGALTPP